MEDDTVEVVEVHTLRRVKGFKKAASVFAIVFVVMLMLPLLYNYVIPRQELTIVTIYHERIGSTSVGYITVALKIENTGTTDITDINATLHVITTLHVINGTMDLKGWNNQTFDLIKAREYKTVELTFSGSHYKDYMISITIKARFGNQWREKRYSHEVIESESKWMSIEWTDTL